MAASCLLVLALAVPAAGQQSSIRSGTPPLDPVAIQNTGREFHVAPHGKDSNAGTPDQPFDIHQAGVYGDDSWKKLAASTRYPEPYVVP